MPEGNSKPAPASDWGSLQMDVTLTPGEFLTYSADDKKVISMPYPIAGDGMPVDPSVLVLHTLIRCFEPPRCFHDSQVCIRVDSTPNSPYNGHIVASCNALNNQCPFFFDITAVVESPSFTTIPKLEYPRRALPPLPPVVETLRVSHGSRRGGLKPIYVIEDRAPPPNPLPISPVLVSHGKHYRQPQSKASTNGGLRSIWQLSEGGVSYADFMKMFVQCPVCANVVIGECFEDHLDECDTSA